MDNSDFDDEGFPRWAKILFWVIFVCILAWIFILQPFIEWVKLNIVTVSVVSGVIIVVLVTVFVFYRIYRAKRNEVLLAKKRAYEQEQMKKGLVKFVDRFGRERWGTHDEAKAEELINRITGAIERFPPARKYRDEFPYQTDLHGWLIAQFPSTKIEIQRGSSRPDIIVDNIAIEVKGPTRTSDLVTIADKCIRYGQHFDGPIIVLFELDVSEKRYYEWKKGLENTYPNARVIRKD
ncbi:MAG TPA: hypothetical protein VMX96_03945 [Dehalococcoidia bacterium]|nr:hypothetical protein [Dehalococcoidia bacterium]